MLASGDGPLLPRSELRSPIREMGHRTGNSSNAASCGLHGQNRADQSESGRPRRENRNPLGWPVLSTRAGQERPLLISRAGRRSLGLSRDRQTCPATEIELWLPFGGVSIFCDQPNQGSRENGLIWFESLPSPRTYAVDGAGESRPRISQPSSSCSSLTLRSKSSIRPSG